MWFQIFVLILRSLQTQYLKTSEDYKNLGKHPTFEHSCGFNHLILASYKQRCSGLRRTGFKNKTNMFKVLNESFSAIKYIPTSIILTHVFKTRSTKFASI